jgi:hypothetical protein
MTGEHQVRRFGGDTFAIVAVLALGIALITLAVPRTAAYSLMVPGKAVLSDLARGKTVGPERLRAAIAGHEKALSWLDDPDGWIEIGAFTLVLARQRNMPDVDRTSLLDQSRGAISTGLALAPLRPFGWSRLAQVHQMLGRDAETMDRLLGISAATGALEPRLLTQRVRIGYAARSGLSDATAARLTAEVRLWAKHQPTSLADWGRRHYALPWVRQALKEDESLQGRFLDAYLRLPAR